MGIQLYEVSPKYINYLLPFAPLSSFKPKHQTMKETLDFIKLGRYSVINLNNMFPIPDGQYQYIDISRERDAHHKSLLMAEYRIIRVRQDLIKKNAAELFKHKTEKGNSTALAKRCNDFSLLEEACKNYIP